MIPGAVTIAVAMAVCPVSRLSSPRNWAGPQRAMSVSAAPGMGTLTDDTSTLGNADVGAQGMSLSDQGLSGTPTGGRRGDARAGEPGVNELRGGAGAAQAPGSTSAGRWRDMARIGRVRSWVGNNE